jgi:excisionase family DNA binding protein
MTTDEILIGVERASEILGIGRSKLLEMTYKGDILSVKVGRRRLYKKAYLQEWAEALMEEDAIELPR